MEDDAIYMRQAIDAARKCEPEDGRTHPLVGAVVVRAGKPPVIAYRGALRSGEHAEYTALEGVLKDESLVGATVFTTLEPCTTRNHPKVPCATRLVERKVARVVIGMLDPNPQIRGKGLLQLRKANIEVSLFAPEFMDEIEELNRDFIRDQERQGELPPPSPELIRSGRERSLDHWYELLNRIYWNQNFHRDAASIFSHLVEVVGGLTALATNKRKITVEPEVYIVKAFAWWIALCGKMNIRSVEDILWDKFPGVCTYCHKVPHDPDICSHKKAETKGPQWDTLSTLGKGKTRPSRFGQWQVLFSRIYPVQTTEDYGPSFAKLMEELGELSEAVRVYRSEPGYFLSEAADVFAWLMHIQNIVDSKRNVPIEKRGEALEISMSKAYPEGCTECKQRLCTCPPILASTIGRIGHEVPGGRAS